MEVEQFWLLLTVKPISFQHFILPILSNENLLNVRIFPDYPAIDEPKENS